MLQPTANPRNYKWLSATHHVITTFNRQEQYIVAISFTWYPANASRRSRWCWRGSGRSTFINAACFVVNRCLRITLSPGSLNVLALVRGTEFSQLFTSNGPVFTSGIVRLTSSWTLCQFTQRNFLFSSVYTLYCTLAYIRFVIPFLPSSHHI